MDMFICCPKPPRASSPRRWLVRRKTIINNQEKKNGKKLFCSCWLLMTLYTHFSNFYCTKLSQKPMLCLFTSPTLKPLGQAPGAYMPVSGLVFQHQTTTKNVEGCLILEHWTPFWSEMLPLQTFNQFPVHTENRR